MYIGVCLCGYERQGERVYVIIQVYTWLTDTSGDLEIPEPGVTIGYEPSNIVARNQTLVLLMGNKCS